jgi:regulator of protease activity HflC (stomatin/prohibitin superfamily)
MEYGNRIQLRNMKKEVGPINSLIEWVGRALCAFFVLLLIFTFAIAVVPAGHIGVQDTFGQVSDVGLKAGFYFKSPITAILPMGIQTQKYSVTATAASRDLQDVTTEITLNYRLMENSVPTIYKTVGVNYQDKVIVPAVQESVKAATAQFAASELITERPLVKDKVQQILSSRLQEYFIFIEQVSLTDFKFSEQFTKAIEAKVTAEQDAFKAENDLKRIKIEKEQTITQAEAVAQSVKLRADADAYAIKVVNEELAKSKDIIRYRSIEKWNGILPVYTGATVPFVDITAIER